MLASLYLLSPGSTAAWRSEHRAPKLPKAAVSLPAHCIHIEHGKLTTTTCNLPPTNEGPNGWLCPAHAESVFPSAKALTTKEEA
jgi:hypothetical protein